MGDWNRSANGYWFLNFFLGLIDVKVSNWGGKFVFCLMGVIDWKTSS